MLYFCTMKIIRTTDTDLSQCEEVELPSNKYEALSLVKSIIGGYMEFCTCHLNDEPWKKDLWLFVTQQKYTYGNSCTMPGSLTGKNDSNVLCYTNHKHCG